MKLKFLYITFIVASVLLCGCKQAAEDEDVIFITGTESQPTTTFTIDGTSASMGLTVTSTAKLDKDSKVTLKACPELLEAYNKNNNRTYEVPPVGSYELTNGEITIKDGQYMSTQAKLNILSIENFKEGVTYCIPVSISNADNSLNILEPSRTVYVVLNRVAYSKAVNLGGSIYFSVPTFATSSDVGAMLALTMECKLYVNNFQDGSPFISSVMGIEENFLLRFGDVSCDKNQLQMAGGKVGGKKYPMTTETHFSTGQWYHVAVVYNGSNLTLYINGKQETYATTSGGTINFNDTYMDGFHIGRSERGRYLDGYISEARVWNKALTPNQLQANVCYVDPTSSGLIAYWRFNGTDQDGTTIKDLTGHGHDAVASGTINWVENQKCPF
jgi:hypothetical protein